MSYLPLNSVNSASRGPLDPRQCSWQAEATDPHYQTRTWIFIYDPLLSSARTVNPAPPRAAAGLAKALTIFPSCEVSICGECRLADGCQLMVDALTNDGTRLL